MIEITKGNKMKKIAGVVIKPRKKKVVNSPLKKKNKLDLKKLVSKINSKNLHPEINFGPPVGKESF